MVTRPLLVVLGSFGSGIFLCGSNNPAPHSIGIILWYATHDHRSE